MIDSIGRRIDGRFLQLSRARGETFLALLAALARRGRAIARTRATLEAGAWLVGTAHNFCWVHEALRQPAPAGSGQRWRERTPAMAAGLINRVWSLEEVLRHRVPLPTRVAPKQRGHPTTSAAPPPGRRMISVQWSRTNKIGDRDNLASLPYGAGIPKAAAELTVPVPFNDAPAIERRIERLTAEGRKPACVIMEPAMMNLGVVLPEPGYLEAIREITRRHGIVLIFDEVKTGLCVAPGGATDKFGVLPDMVTLAKAVGGGLPSGAIGCSEEVAEVVLSGKVYRDCCATVTSQRSLLRLLGRSSAIVNFDWEIDVLATTSQIGGGCVPIVL